MEIMKEIDKGLNNKKLEKLQLELNLLGYNDTRYNITCDINGVKSTSWKTSTYQTNDTPIIHYCEVGNYKKLVFANFDMDIIPSSIWEMKLTHLKLKGNISNIPQKLFNKAKNLIVLNIMETNIRILPLFYNKRRLKFIILPIKNWHLIYLTATLLIDKLPKCLERMIKHKQVKIFTTTEICKCEYHKPHIFGGSWRIHVLNMNRLDRAISDRYSTRLILPVQ